VDADRPDRIWKLKLRYGRLKTPYRHYTVIAEGVVGELAQGFSCPAGDAFMGMKTWASSPDEAMDMIHVIGKEIGFTVTGRMYLYDTEPSQPPRATPHGYDIAFTPFTRKKHPHGAT
jgi:hypothetical protein